MVEEGDLPVKSDPIQGEEESKDLPEEEDQNLTDKAEKEGSSSAGV